MQAYAIVMKDHEISEFGYDNLCRSSLHVKNNFEITRFDAVLPPQIDELMQSFDIKWNYPWEGEVIDFASGLKKSAYVTANPKHRIAAALSHYSLWHKVSMMDQPILILEHDANFMYKLDLDTKKIPGDIVGINNPLGCTRRAKLYYEKIITNQYMFQLAPYIDDITVPQGLAGNSAYIIKPNGGKKLLQLVDQYGLWPNDAIMCKQLIPDLYVTRKSFTTIQNLKSTTTL